MSQSPDSWDPIEDAQATREILRWDAAERLYHAWTGRPRSQWEKCSQETKQRWYRVACVVEKL